jgi:chromosome segregation ATPase
MTPSREFDAIEAELAEITAELDRLDAARASLMQRLIELGRRVRELSPSSAPTPN